MNWSCWLHFYRMQATVWSKYIYSNEAIVSFNEREKENENLERLANMSHRSNNNNRNNVWKMRYNFRGIIYITKELKCVWSVRFHCLTWHFNWIHHFIHEHWMSKMTPSSQWTKKTTTEIRLMHFFTSRSELQFNTMNLCSILIIQLIECETYSDCMRMQRSNKKRNDIANNTKNRANVCFFFSLLCLFLFSFHSLLIIRRQNICW